MGSTVNKLARSVGMYTKLKKNILYPNHATSCCFKAYFNVLAGTKHLTAKEVNSDISQIAVVSVCFNTYLHKMYMLAKCSQYCSLSSLGPMYTFFS